MSLKSIQITPSAVPSPPDQHLPAAQALGEGRCDELGIQDPALELDLWDAILKQIMLYGVEVWGSGALSKEVTGEKIHRAFVRRLLNVPSGTSTMADLAEVGRYPMRVSAAVVMLK